ncbi:isoprenylcysteine carboxyl methyltransferase family protein [Sporosarcina aquimarina]|uniref:Isoprenylcysteine carboxylmethyltransferase family protein n=1 Tax=Sporosarcina aquimarina TaxID=114975 RepID=A0ABU4FZR3_9BACL|nr:isoprenylcysteine carboxylmethyltransferase family protein [Sporosarcina aquimarina]MDW0110202.1 isoprenylcysteine carboxylmethyltransferase family protein [Sporosarcina aquimarina]
MFFWIVLSVVILQRLAELIIAKNNEKRMLAQGAYEVGARHYPAIVLLHTAFFVSLLLEVVIRKPGLSPIWGILLTLFLLTQVLRVWCLASLGKYWNTKIIILPGADVVMKGPYKFIRHPNYFIVAMEILVLPMIFGAYFTAILFTLLNAWMMSVRIPQEERALKDATNYKEKFSLE